MTVRKLDDKHKHDMHGLVDNFDSVRFQWLAVLKVVLPLRLRFFFRCLAEGRGRESARTLLCIWAFVVYKTVCLSPFVF